MVSLHTYIIWMKVESLRWNYLLISEQKTLKIYRHRFDATVWFDSAKWEVLSISRATIEVYLRHERSTDSSQYSRFTSSSAATFCIFIFAEDQWWHNGIPGEDEPQRLESVISDSIIFMTEKGGKGFYKCHSQAVLFLLMLTCRVAAIFAASTTSNSSREV